MNSTDSSQQIASPAQVDHGAADGAAGRAEAGKEGGGRVGAADQDWRYQPDRRGRQLAQAVRQVVRIRQLWLPGQRVLLACSGGPDSLAALLLLDHLRRSLGHQLTVGLVDHGLQSNRTQAEQLVRQACESRRIPLRVARVSVPAGPQLEARARELRYAALQQLKGELECAVIVTAHHADDQAETWLMRSGRGAGVAGLAAIRFDRGDGVVRPFLVMDRADLAHVLGGRPAWTDPSNSDTHHLRNRLRAQVLPQLESAMPGAARAMARTAAHLQDESAAVQTWMELALHYAGVGSAVQDGCIRLPAELVALHPSALGPLLHWVCNRLQVAPLGQGGVEQIAASARLTGDAVVRIAGLTAHRSLGMWTFSRSDVARV